MKIDWGFVSICLSEKDCSPAGTVQVRHIEPLDEEGRRYRVLQVATANLQKTLRIMWFLRAHQIACYRISAQLVPLATHEMLEGWAWWEEPALLEIGAKIGSVVRAEGYRLSSHLPEVCGLTSPGNLRWTKAYLEYHKRLFDLLHLDERHKIVMHVGGAYGNKEEALERAREGAAEFTEWERGRVVLENDDRTFTLLDVLGIAEEFGLGVAFDWHHHLCHSEALSDERLKEALGRAFSLWRDRPPKVHLSSPKSERQPRAHAEYVDVEYVRPFFALAAETGIGALDVMVEAKMKDLALFRLREALDWF